MIAMDVQETPTGNDHVNADEQAIVACVQRFYAMANDDSLLGPIFAQAITDWPEHLRQMSDFWSRVLLGSARYQRDPFTPHHTLGLEAAHFDRWRDLFQTAVRETLDGPLRERAVGAAAQMSHCWRHQMIAK
jgi:hemoglobin